MKVESPKAQPRQRGSVMIGFFIIMVVTVTTIAGLGAYVAQSSNGAHRRNDMIAAIQFAEGGAVIACKDLNSAVTNLTTGSLNTKLVNVGYSQNSSLSTSSQTVYQRTIGSPFTNQSVTARIWLPNSSSPTSAKVTATATKGKVTQTATVNVKMSWGYPAAIISTNPGTQSTSLSKDVDSGNVVVNGDKTGPIVVHGGDGLAILANGYVNIDPTFATAAPVSATNYGTANEIPDYTAQGTANTLFDFNRYIAIANLTTNALNPTKNNHFTNLATFFAANNKVSSPTNANPASRFLEGVVVVEISGKDSNLSNMDPSHLGYGINVKGTLFFNFDSSFGASSKVINTATMNINPADMTGFVATNSATYQSGYPPVYYDNSKNPTNINIAASYPYANVAPDEDLPALVYSIGILDIHGNANVSGVMYTPSFCEIENKADNQIQYFKGSIICGLGIYFENNKKSSSVISFDSKVLDSLATLGGAGKNVQAVFWQ